MAIVNKVTKFAANCTEGSRTKDIIGNKPYRKRCRNRSSPHPSPLPKGEGTERSRQISLSKTRINLPDCSLSQWERGRGVRRKAARLFRIIKKSGTFQERSTIYKRGWNRVVVYGQVAASIPPPFRDSVGEVGGVRGRSRPRPVWPGAGCPGRSRCPEPGWLRADRPRGRSRCPCQGSRAG